MSVTPEATRPDAIPAGCADVALASIAWACRANTAHAQTLHAHGVRLVVAPAGEDHVKRHDATDAEPVTWFHSASIPTVSIVALGRVFADQGVWSFSDVASLQAAVLMRRFCERTGLLPSEAVMHRLFLVALLVSAKAHHDTFPRNDAFAMAAGLPTCEVNRLEVALACGCDWRLQVTAEEVMDLVAQLARHERGDGPHPFELQASPSDDNLAPVALGTHAAHVRPRAAVKNVSPASGERPTLVEDPGCCSSAMLSTSIDTSATDTGGTVLPGVESPSHNTSTNDEATADIC